MAQKRSSSPSHGAPSQRQLRVGELIRRRLSEVLARAEVHDPELNRMSITVGEVRASPDLKVATAYVTPLGGQGREEALAALRRNKGELRRMVAAALALKFAPELRFAHDETFDRLDETRRLFAQEAVRRDLEEDLIDAGAIEGERDPTEPYRDIREDMARPSDLDSDDAAGANDWDDEDEDRDPEDYDPYMTADGDAELRPVDELMDDERAARRRDEDEGEPVDGRYEDTIAEIGEDGDDEDADDDEGDAEDEGDQPRDGARNPSGRR